MAFGELVKSLVVRFSSENFEFVKGEIDDIPDKKTVKVDFDVSSLSGAKLRALAALMREQRLGADQSLMSGQDVSSLSGARLAALTALMREQRLAASADSSGGGGFLSRLMGSLFGSAAVSGATGAGAGIPVIGGLLSTIGPGGALVGAIGVLSTGILGIIPALVSAGGAVTAFGALAYPTFSKIFAAVSGTAGAMKALDPAQRQIVRGIQGLETEFGKLSVQLEPVVTKIAGVAIQIAQKLLPGLLPFAQVAGGAILKLLDGFDKFASSPGFKQFTAEMLKLAGPAILTIGQGIGRVAIAFGKLIEALINPNGIRMLRILFDTVEWVVQGIAFAFKWATPKLIEFYQWFAIMTRLTVADIARLAKDFAHWAVDVADAVDHVWHAVQHAWDNVTHATDVLDRDMANAWKDIGRSVLTWVETVVRYGADVVKFFAQLPGKIINALSNLASMLFNAGKHAIQGLINGIQSMMGGVGGVMHAVMSVVGSFLPGSPAKTGPLSGDGWSYVRGQHFATDFGAGMLSRSSVVAAAARGVAGAAGLNAGVSGRLGGAGGPVQVVLEFRGADQALVTALKKIIRVRGGNPAVIGR